MHAHVTILFGTKDAQGYDPATSAAVLEKLLKLYYDRGVTLLTGSDLPNPWVIPGVSYHQELALLAEAGIPPLEILKMATHNGAEALGILAEVGTLEPGKQADLVVLQADPLADIHNTRRIEKVMQRGEWTLTPAPLPAPPALSPGEGRKAKTTATSTELFLPLVSPLPAGVWGELGEGPGVRAHPLARAAAAK